jgi:predicted PurR-regulated permease PerM
MDDPMEVAEPANLRFLRRLVTVLTVVMICGVLVVVGLLVTRLNRSAPPLPDQITLPEGTTARAFTQAEDWFAVVTDQDEILIYDRLTGALRQTIKID